MNLRASKHGIWLALVLALAFCRAAKADTVYVDGTYGFADYSTGTGYGIPPYGGMLTSGGITQNEQFFCVDFAHDITGGMSWNVTVTSLTGSSFSSTFLGSSAPYMTMAYLVSEMMGSSTNMMKAEYQYAIWSLTGGPNPYGNAASLVAGAAKAVSAGLFNPQGWEILTPTGSTGQEFLIYAAEPSVLVMLIAGLFTLALIVYKRGAL